MTTFVCVTYARPCGCACVCACVRVATALGCARVCNALCVRVCGCARAVCVRMRCEDPHVHFLDALALVWDHVRACLRASTRAEW